MSTEKTTRFQVKSREFRQHLDQLSSQRKNPATPLLDEKSKKPTLATAKSLFTSIAKITLLDDSRGSRYFFVTKKDSDNVEIVISEFETIPLGSISETLALLQANNFVMTTVLNRDRSTLYLHVTVPDPYTEFFQKIRDDVIKEQGHNKSSPISQKPSFSDLTASSPLPSTSQISSLSASPFLINQPSSSNFSVGSPPPSPLSSLPVTPRLRSSSSGSSLSSQRSSSNLSLNASPLSARSLENSPSSSLLSISPTEQKIASSTPKQFSENIKLLVKKFILADIDEDAFSQALDSEKLVSNIKDIFDRQNAIDKEAAIDMFCEHVSNTYNGDSNPHGHDRRHAECLEILCDEFCLVGETSILKQLLTAFNSSGRTILHEAARIPWGGLSLNILLEKANSLGLKDYVNQRDDAVLSHGSTALNNVVALLETFSSRHIEGIKTNIELLLAYGANPGIQGTQDKTNAFDIAREKAHICLAVAWGFVTVHQHHKPSVLKGYEEIYLKGKEKDIKLVGGAGASLVGVSQDRILVKVVHLCALLEYAQTKPRDRLIAFSVFINSVLEILPGLKVENVRAEFFVQLDKVEKELLSSITSSYLEDFSSEKQVKSAALILSSEGRQRLALAMLEKLLRVEKRAGSNATSQLNQNASEVCALTVACMRCIGLEYIQNQATQPFESQEKNVRLASKYLAELEILNQQLEKETADQCMQAILSFLSQYEGVPEINAKLQEFLKNHRSKLLLTCSPPKSDMKASPLGLNAFLKSQSAPPALPSSSSSSLSTAQVGSPTRQPAQGGSGGGVTAPITSSCSLSAGSS